MAEALPDPDLRSVSAAFVAAGAEFVVIGGFAVVAHRHVRATQDVDVLIPDEDPDNDERCLAALTALSARPLGARTLDLAGRHHLRVISESGIVDLLREGEPPLDFAGVREGALAVDLGDGPFAVAGLAALVTFKRLADRPVDRQDLAALEEVHGTLPFLEVRDMDHEGPGTT